MKSPQGAARAYLRTFARTCTADDLHVVTDEGDIWMQPESQWDDPVYTEPYLWIDESAGEADLSVRWAVSDPDGRGWYQGAEERDKESDYGDVSMRHVAGVSRAARERLALLIEEVLREGGWDPSRFSIGGDPRQGVGA